MSSPIRFILACLEKSRSDWEGEDDLVQLQAGACRLCQRHLCHSKVLERFPIQAIFELNINLDRSKKNPHVNIESADCLEVSKVHSLWLSSSILHLDIAIGLSIYWWGVLTPQWRLSLMQCWNCLQHNAITDCPNLCNSVSCHYLEACQLVCLFCKRESEREENIQIWLSETKSEAKGHTGSANTGKHSAHSYADITDINGWIWTAWFKDMSQAEIGIPTWIFLRQAQVKQGKFWWYDISIPGQTHQHYRGKEGRGKGLTTYWLLHFQSCSPHH